MKKLYDQSSWVDLSLGTPHVFKEYLQNYMQDATPSRQVKLHELMPYNKTGLLPELETQIKKLHQKYHPNLFDSQSQIIVTNGATHALMALFHLASKQSDTVYIPAPFWFRLNSMAEMQGARLNHVNQGECAIITVPNNPDGALCPDKLHSFSHLWYDCVYNWPWYFKNSQNFPPTIWSNGFKPQAAVFSLSKFSGHCGSRIGWVVVNDQNLASFLGHYVEYDTSGVSVEAQIRAASVIDNFISNNLETKYHEILNQRKNELEIIIKKIYELTPNPLQSDELFIENGMFAWIKDRENVFGRVNVQGMDAHLCGGQKDFIRINLCASSEDWNEAIFRLNMFMLSVCDNI